MRKTVQKLQLNFSRDALFHTNTKVCLMFFGQDCRNKFENLPEIIKENVDVIAVAKSKIGVSYSSTQFFLEGYHSPYRLDYSPKSGGLLVYVKVAMPTRQLSLPKFHFRIHALPFELNLGREKWSVISI